MTPDGWVRFYYDMRDSFGAPALNYIDTVGRIYAKRCSKCHARIRHCTNDHVWVCGKCGEVWKFWMRALSKGEIQKSIRPFGYDDANSRYFDIARLLHLFLRERPHDGKLYVLHAMGESSPDLAEKFPIRFPDAPGPWNERTVRRRIKSAREDWNDRLAAAGIKVN